MNSFIFSNLAWRDKVFSCSLIEYGVLKSNVPMSYIIWAGILGNLSLHRCWLILLILFLTFLELIVLENSLDLELNSFLIMLWSYKYMQTIKTKSFLPRKSQQYWDEKIAGLMALNSSKQVLLPPESLLSFP